MQRLIVGVAVALVPDITGAPVGDSVTSAEGGAVGEIGQSAARVDLVLAVGQFVPAHAVSSGNAFDAAAKYMLYEPLPNVGSPVGSDVIVMP